MFNAEGIIDGLLAEIGSGGVFNINTVPVFSVKGGDDAVVGREQVPDTVPGIVQSRLRESAQYGAYEVIGQDREEDVGSGRLFALMIVWSNS